MRRSYFALVTLLLLTAGLCFAQQDASSTAQQPAASASSADQQTSVGQPTDTNEQLFKGCVSGTKDNYTLTDEKSGQKYRLHSDKDINEHAGNMVEIKGTVKAEGVDHPATASDSQASSGSVAGQTSSSAADASKSAERELDVADIKTVSKGCSADQSKK